IRVRQQPENVAVPAAAAVPRPHPCGRTSPWPSLYGKRSPAPKRTLADVVNELNESSLKRRRSWKEHKVQDEGLYACDQCDKMFGKQSSLARHKYEHSETIPYHQD
ncbi:conserved hypothetical protein, partial [Trichinella spiralis]|uniref:hypothetical protein n=1 Tax=Trichinella spiralis TaxID=6334 RepID=UPI0001EFE9F3